ncbi:MAG: hypothetical protein ACI9BW_002150 [Gammaproteobacteria bacterium]|jgi:hypothetical protein
MIPNSYIDRIYVCHEKYNLPFGYSKNDTEGFNIIPSVIYSLFGGIKRQPNEDARHRLVLSALLVPTFINLTSTRIN